jgi:hypothetical protein
MPRLLVIAALAIAPFAAHAQTAVYRCIGEHGEISFSSTRCAGASAAAAPSSDAPSTIAPEGARAKSTCLASAEALRDVVAEAFSRRDANALAGVMRWRAGGAGCAGATVPPPVGSGSRSLCVIRILLGPEAAARRAPQGTPLDCRSPAQAGKLLDRV